MKTLLFMAFSLVLIITYAQNAEDTYGDHTGIEFYPQTVADLTPWEGEYQIFLDQFFWARGPEMDEGSISFSIEIVSFPFVPDR